MNEAEAEALARRLATPEGLRELRLRQAAEREAPEYEPVEVEDGPEPIGPWRPAGDGRFVRERPWTAGDFWAPAEQIGGPKTRPRVVLLGESAAAGMFYRPHLSPASVLQTLLPGHEVVDLARISIDRYQLIELAYQALQLEPDVVVFFAGNNWARRAGPWADLAAMQAWGDALEAGGVPALVAAGRAALRQDVEDALDDLASLEVPVVLVVPESNLADWERRRPPPWLPGDGSPRWHALWEAGEAESLVQLDGGLCAASQRLLARSRQDDAGRFAACRAEIEAASWDGWFSGVPQASDTLRNALLEGGARRGFRLLDLREAFAAHTGSPLPGRRLFIDYCHLTPEAMGVAAAGIASRILGTTLAPMRPEPAPDVEARARFMAWMHRVHMEAPLDRRPPRFEGPPEFRRDLAEMKASGVPAVLTAAWRRMPRLDPHVWTWPYQDAEILEAVDALPPSAGPVELAGLHHLERPSEAFLEGSACDPRLADRAYLRAPWPRTAFRVGRAAGEAGLRITARVPVVETPRPGEIVVIVNGARIGTLPSSPRWTRAELRVSWKAGWNRVELLWPALAADGDAALALARERCLLGLWADLFPVFGELASLYLSGP